MTFDILRSVQIEWSGQPDPEVDTLIRDLVSVDVSVHQSMAIVGPWFEGRVSHLIRRWLPDGWMVSGPSQVFDPARPGLRSRSWDIVVHSSNVQDLPPEAYPGAGFVALPRAAVAAVIDTKTYLPGASAYAAKTIFDATNSAIERQLDFLGSSITPILLVARSTRSPSSLRQEGRSVGLEVLSLAQDRTKIIDGRSSLTLHLRSDSGPFDAWRSFRHSISDAVGRKSRA